MSADKQRWQSLLNNGLMQLNLELPKENQEKLIEFLILLKHWNQSINLTAITNIDEMIALHLLDSLAIAPYLKGDYVLDVGTGAGFPGVPLASFFTAKKFVLLDGNGKKISFLTQAKAKLELNNIEPCQQRVETFKQSQFTTVVARAVTDIKTLYTICQPQLATPGRLLFLKGRYPKAELESLPVSAKVEQINVPGIEASRHLVVFDQ